MSADQIDLEDAILRVAGEVAPVFEQSVQSQYLDEFGREKPNPVPLQPPIGYVRRPTIADQIRQAIRQASLEAAQMGAETEEEANDFDVGEDFDPESPYEHDFEIDPVLEAKLALQSAPPKKKADGAAPSDPDQTPSGPANPPKPSGAN